MNGMCDEYNILMYLMIHAKSPIVLGIEAVIVCISTQWYIKKHHYLELHKIPEPTFI